MSAFAPTPSRSLAELEAEAASLRVEISEGEADWKATWGATPRTAAKPVNHDMPRLRVKLTILEMRIARMRQKQS